MRSRLFSSVLAAAIAVALSASTAAQERQGGGAPGGAPGAGAPGGRGQGGPGGGGGRGGGRGFNLPPLLMETDAFPDGGIVPPKYVSAGGNPSVLPAFKISNAPAGTVSYAVIFHDIDVALNNTTGDVLHWIAWNIPAASNGWQEGMLPEGSVQGNNMRNQANYMGPGAPAGPRYHHYVFELYALNANLDLPPTTTRDQLIAAMNGKVVAKAAYVGRFKGEPAAGGAPAGAPGGGAPGGGRGRGNQ
jgi:Raf kinase inhibitor-like YbhB/YbcL family protein